MAELKFKQWLKNLDFDEAVTSEYAKSFDTFTQITKAIEERLNDGLSGAPIRVDVEPGFKAKMGRQLSVKLRIPSKNFQTGLYRAYIPDSGAPVQLDLYGEELEACRDDDQLQEKLFGFVESIKDRIIEYRRYAGS
jgi:hypothetical protein